MQKCQTDDGDRNSRSITEVVAVVLKERKKKALAVFTPKWHFLAGD
jgi:hypothetical protein